MAESQQLRVAHLQSYIDRFRAKATKANRPRAALKCWNAWSLSHRLTSITRSTFSFRAPESLPNPLLKMESQRWLRRTGDSGPIKQTRARSRIGLLAKRRRQVDADRCWLKNSSRCMARLASLKALSFRYFCSASAGVSRADESPLQHLARLAPQETEQKLRDYPADLVSRAIRVNEETQRFSGGEKARLVLALIVWQRPNLLLLDETDEPPRSDMRQALTGSAD